MYIIIWINCISSAFSDMSSSPTQSSAREELPADGSVSRASQRKVVIERIILCTALFFPLFLSSLDTSPYLFLMLVTNLQQLLLRLFLVQFMLEPFLRLDIASSFDQLNGQSWIANAYLLTNTAFLPAYGQMADIFGRHAVMQSAILIFLVGSALCTGAQTWSMLLAGRGIAGIGGMPLCHLRPCNFLTRSCRLLRHD